MPGASTPPAPPCGPDSGQSTRRPKRSNSARGLCKGPLLLGTHQRLPHLPRPRLLTTRTPPAQLRNIRVRSELRTLEALPREARNDDRPAIAIVDPLQQRRARPGDKRLTRDLQDSRSLVNPLRLTLATQLHQVRRVRRLLAHIHRTQRPIQETLRNTTPGLPMLLRNLVQSV